MAQRQVADENRRRGAQEPQRRCVFEQSPYQRCRQRRFAQECAQARGACGRHLLVVLHFLDLHDIVEHLSEHIGSGEKPRVPARDHMAVGSERRTERVERRHRNHAVTVAPHHQCRETSIRTGRPLAAEVGSHGDASGVGDCQRVTDHVAHEDPRKKPGGRSVRAREHELDHRFDEMLRTQVAES